MEKLYEQLAPIFQAGALTSLGALAAYMRSVDKSGTKVKAFTLFTNAFVAFLLGTAVIDFMPEAVQQYKGGILLMCGFFCYPILDTIEKKLLKYIGTV